MAGLRWRAPTALNLVAVFALCFSLQQALPLAAKDNTDGKSSDKKSQTAAAKKKAAKKREQKIADGSVDGSSAGQSGTATGAGGSTTGVGGQSNGGGTGANGGANTGNANNGQNNNAAPNGRAVGAAAKTPVAKGQGRIGSKVNGAGQGRPAAPAQLDAQNPLVKKVIDVQNRNTAALMAQKGIVGTGTGLDDDGNVVIRVYTSGADSPKIPAQIENVPVLEVLTGPLHPYQVVLPATPLQQTRMPRPCPIGTTAIWDPGVNGTVCAAATLGCRLIDSNGNIYGLSNNHVWADENNNPIGTPAVQPSPGDANCVFGVAADQIGTLAAFLPLVFDGTTPNPCDAAIIISNSELINTSTLKDGYGVPTSTNAPAFLGQLVQKYGRTTGYTRGKVVGINVTATIGYTNGPCLFTDFIDIFPVAPFANFGNPGDSGSLVVDMARNPVGIVVGGGGGDAFHSPIGIVLRELELQLVQQSNAPPGTKLRVDSSPATTIGKEGRGQPNSP